MLEMFQQGELQALVKAAHAKHQLPQSNAIQGAYSKLPLIQLTNKV